MSTGAGSGQISPPVAAKYPREREAEIALRDGSTVHVRPVRRTDAQAVENFLKTVSPESIGFRFFGTPDLSWVTRWSVDVDYADRFAVVAETGDPGQIVAHAAYIRDGAQSAEVAFLVADAWQGKGISTALLAHIAEVAEAHGISTFHAEVLPANHRMIAVFRDSGFPVVLHAAPDAIQIELPTSLSPDALARFDERDAEAAVAAVQSFFEPSSIALIGASHRRGTVGGEILHNLLLTEFGGPVYAVNRQVTVVQSLPAYRSVTDIPVAVDLAVVAVPADEVIEVARECADKEVRALLVISAGFAESGSEGAARQHELLEVCRAAGMRLVGPNCLGVLNTAPGVSLNATFAPHRAIPGRVAFMSQSGGLGIALVEAAGRLGIGLSSFVSVGNKADLSGNDFLRYWEQDSGTDVVLMYLESFGNPRKFARIAPHLARHKPLLVVKSGRSSAGARGTLSHTGALLSSSDVTVDALFEQAGVIRTDTLHELFAVGALLSAQPVPSGDRVAIVTNAGGPGILCADACQADGVDVPELPSQVQDALSAFLADAASVRNPVDMISTASAEDYRRVLEALVESEACDAILAIFVPPLITRADDVASAIREVAETTSNVPIAAVFMTADGAPPELTSATVRVPGFEFPEEAARAVALAARYGRWRSRPRGDAGLPAGLDLDRAAALVSGALGRGCEWLAAEEVAELLECYGLPMAQIAVVSDATEAAAKAAELGFPVALKASSRGLLHKSDFGGVRLGLHTPEAVHAAAEDIRELVADAGRELDGLIVQPMVAPGVELIVGVVHDPSFGPVLACGAGGVTAELIKDVAVRITPLTDADAHDMLRSLRTFPLLDGYRGAPHCDLDAVEDVIRRVSAMVEAHPEITELDCNPLISRPDGVVIVDARVRLTAAPPPPPMPSLKA